MRAGVSNVSRNHEAWLACQSEVKINVTARATLCEPHCPWRQRTPFISCIVQTNNVTNETMSAQARSQGGNGPPNSERCTKNF